MSTPEILWKSFWSLVALPFAAVLILLAFVAGGPRGCRHMYDNFF